MANIMSYNKLAHIIRPFSFLPFLHSPPTLPLSFLWFLPSSFITTVKLLFTISRIKLQETLFSYFTTLGAVEGKVGSFLITAMPSHVIKKGPRWTHEKINFSSVGLKIKYHIKRLWHLICSILYRLFFYISLIHVTKSNNRVRLSWWKLRVQ